MAMNVADNLERSLELQKCRLVLHDLRRLLDEEVHIVCRECNGCARFLCNKVTRESRVSVIAVFMFTYFLHPGEGQGRVEGREALTVRYERPLFSFTL